jgi:hypothetical protein
MMSQWQTERILKLEDQVVELEQQLAAEKEKNRWRPMTEPQVCGTLGIKYYFIKGGWAHPVEFFKNIPDAGCLFYAIYWQPVDSPEAANE